MHQILLIAYVIGRTTVSRFMGRIASERGEGVVSTAIAVLIMAFLGALMWVGFREIWVDARDTTKEQVGEIGR